MLVRKNSVAIVGWDEGSAGQIHSWLEAASGLHIACFVHDGEPFAELDPAVVLHGRVCKQFSFPQGGMFKGLPLVASPYWPRLLLGMGIGRALVAMPDEVERLSCLAKAKAAGIECISAIHPTATIMADAILHPNVILHARAFVGYRAELYCGTIVNTGAQIDHHAVLYACCTIDPGVICAGNVAVEECAHIGPGAVITKRVRIGREAVVAAGAVVVRDVRPKATVFGIPARARPI